MWVHGCTTDNWSCTRIVWSSKGAFLSGTYKVWQHFVIGDLHEEKGAAVARSWQNVLGIGTQSWEKIPLEFRLIIGDITSQGDLLWIQVKDLCISCCKVFCSQPIELPIWVIYNHTQTTEAVVRFLSIIELIRLFFFFKAYLCFPTVLLQIPRGIQIRFSPLIQAFVEGEPLCDIWFLRTCLSIWGSKHATLLLWKLALHALFHQPLNSSTGALNLD